jgi:hypothetical protein
VDYVLQEDIVHLDQLPHLPAVLENTVQVLELKQNSIVFHVILDSSVLGLVVQMPLRNVLLVITAQEEQEFLHSMKLLLDITHKQELSNQNHVLEANTSLQLGQKHAWFVHKAIIVMELPQLMKLYVLKVTIAHLEVRIQLHVHLVPI